MKHKLNLQWSELWLRSYICDEKHIAPSSTANVTSASPKALTCASSLWSIPHAQKRSHPSTCSHLPLPGRAADGTGAAAGISQGCRRALGSSSWLWRLCQAECDRGGKKSFSIAASLLGIPAQLTDMQISLIISSSKINYILQWLQYVVSGKITFNIFKLIDVSLEKTWLTAARKLGCYLNGFLN